MEVEMDQVGVGEESHVDSQSGGRVGVERREGGLRQNNGRVGLDPHVLVGGLRVTGHGNGSLEQGESEETRTGSVGGGGSLWAEPNTTLASANLNVAPVVIRDTSTSHITGADTGQSPVHDTTMASVTPIAGTDAVRMSLFGDSQELGTSSTIVASAGQNTGLGGIRTNPTTHELPHEPTGGSIASGFPSTAPTNESTAPVGGTTTQTIHNLYPLIDNSSLEHMAFALSPSVLFPPPNASVTLPPTLPPPTHPMPSLLNSAPPPLPTRRTQWMPDFTFGPSSELIDIKKFLEDAQRALHRPVEGQAGSSVMATGVNLEVGEQKWIRPEQVAGWTELEALGAEGRQALEVACSVSDLLAPLTDITSDPAQLNLVKELHNRSTLAALGHTVESIKLPPEKRDRKRKKAGKVDGAEDRSGDDHGDGNQGGENKSAQEGHARGESQGQTSENSGQRAVSPSTTVPEPISGGTPAPATAQMRGGRNRKGKSRPEPEETASDPVLLELGDTLGSLKLRSWSLINTAKHYIRKPRSSDVNVLTEVRPSAIPFTLPDEPSSRPQSLSSNNSGLQGLIERRSAHALMELSVLTPAPHPPHTPRHTLSLALLNSQTLEDISEALVCPNRWIPRSINDSGVPSGACIVVEGTVYGDGEGDADGKDYADKVTEYLAALKAQANTSTGLGKKERDAIMILDEQLEIGLPMLSTRLDSVRWKLHKPYWFMHDGGCVHWVVVSSISLLHPHDPSLPTAEKASNWPYVTSLSPLPHRALCRVCSRVPAVLAISGDSRLGESPSLVCNGCWALLGPPKVGRDYLEGAGGFTVLPLVSPDGL